MDGRISWMAIVTLLIIKTMDHLQQEMSVYRENLGRLQHEFPEGGFVVIKGDAILGVWNDRADALKAGIAEWGNVAFLVKSLDDSKNIINFTRSISFA